MSVEKRAIRRDLRARRKRLSGAFVEAASEEVCARLRRLPAFPRAASVVAYLADENEIALGSLLAEVAESGRELFLPKNVSGPALIRWRLGVPVTVGRGGVLEPSEGVPEIPPSPVVALLPMVAWDETGTRLGRGGGFYDRLFASGAEAVVRVGLAYEFQEYPGLPRDPWDVSVHYVITERRIVCCGQHRRNASPLQKGGLQP